MSYLKLKFLKNPNQCMTHIKCNHIHQWSLVELRLSEDTHPYFCQRHGPFAWSEAWTYILIILISWTCGLLLLTSIVPAHRSLLNCFPIFFLVREKTTFLLKFDLTSLQSDIPKKTLPFIHFAAIGIVFFFHLLCHKHPVCSTMFLICVLLSALNQLQFIFLYVRMVLQLLVTVNIALFHPLSFVINVSQYYFITHTLLKQGCLVRIDAYKFI